MNEYAISGRFDQTWLFAAFAAILLVILLKYWKINTINPRSRGNERSIHKSQKILLVLALIFLIGSFIIPASHESDAIENKQPLPPGITNSTPLNSTRNGLFSAPPAPERIRSNRPMLSQPLDYNRNEITADRHEATVNQY